MTAEEEAAYWLAREEHEAQARRARNKCDDCGAPAVRAYGSYGVSGGGAGFIARKKLCARCDVSFRAANPVAGFIEHCR